MEYLIVYYIESFIVSCLYFYDLSLVKFRRKYRSVYRSSLVYLNLKNENFNSNEIKNNLSYNNFRKESNLNYTYNYKELKGDLHTKEYLESIRDYIQVRIFYTKNSINKRPRKD
jgi:hypothetical protein